MNQFFRDFDLGGFWQDSDYARENYIEAKPTAELIASVENELGYKLPGAYVALMNTQNGGIPVNNCFPTKQRTSWAEDHVAITGIMGIGRTKIYSVCGDLGSRFMQEEWGYPQIGICVCDCPSAGHDMVMLDYRKCGPKGEPAVVHVDQEIDYKVTFLAENFEEFIRGLVNESVYDRSAEQLKRSLEAIKNGAFSPRLARLIRQCPDADFGQALRSVCEAIAKEKGYFALHADEKSHLVYDIQFYLYTGAHGSVTEQEFLKVYPELIALGEGDFTTGGYAPDFVEDWVRERLARGEIVKEKKGIGFETQFAEIVKERARQFVQR